MTLPFPLAALAAFCLAGLAATSAWAQKVPANQITKEQLQQAAEREMTAAVAGLLQSCKKRRPDIGPALDAVWAAEAATASPAMQAYLKTPEFTKAAATYQKEQLAQAATAEGGRQLDELCAAMAEKASSPQRP